MNENSIDFLLALCKIKGALKKVVSEMDVLFEKIYDSEISDNITTVVASAIQKEDYE